MAVWLWARLGSCWDEWPLALRAGLGVWVSEGLGLADFLADLRAELARAEENAGQESLKLGVDRIEVSLEVTSTLERSGSADARVRAQFWVFASAETGVKGSVESGESSRQHLKLTLTPRVEESTTDATGRTTTNTRRVDVDGQVESGEDNPELPPVPNAG